MKKYVWTRKSNDDIWNGGICHSVRECVEEAQYEGYKDTDVFALGYAIPYVVDYVDGDLIIDALQEEAYDELGEVSEGWLDHITLKQREDLNNRLLSVVLDWLKECEEEPTFYKVEPFDELTLQEALEKYENKGETKK